MRGISQFKESRRNTRNWYRSCGFLKLSSLSLITEGVWGLAVLISMPKISWSKLPLDTLWLIQCYIRFSELCFPPAGPSPLLLPLPFPPRVPCTGIGAHLLFMSWRYPSATTIPPFWSFSLLASSQCTISSASVVYWFMQCSETTLEKPFTSREHFIYN